jgi:hypothetical protein
MPHICRQNVGTVGFGVIIDQFGDVGASFYQCGCPVSNRSGLARHHGQLITASSRALPARPTGLASTCSAPSPPCLTFIVVACRRRVELSDRTGSGAPLASTLFSLRGSYNESWNDFHAYSAAGAVGLTNRQRAPQPKPRHPRRLPQQRSFGYKMRVTDA